MLNLINIKDEFNILKDAKIQTTKASKKLN
jgi:hypothetical protein